MGTAIKARARISAEAATASATAIMNDEKAMKALRASGIDYKGDMQGFRDYATRIVMGVGSEIAGVVTSLPRKVGESMAERVDAAQVGVTSMVDSLDTNF
jgi:hypothetical protein